MAELRIPWAYRTSEQNERQAVRFQRISFQLCATSSEKKAMLLQKRFPRGTRHFMRSIVVIAVFLRSTNIDELRCHATLWFQRFFSKTGLTGFSSQL